MESLNRNPFKIIKANDLDNNEINAHWVDMPGQGFLELFSPKSKEAMYIIGGKGSGKTHLMRYFSFYSQSLRYGENIAGQIKKDGYIGIYARASALHATKFDELNIKDAAKNKAFEYYFELWFSINLINIIIEIKQKTPENIIPNESSTVSKIISLLDVAPDNSASMSTFEDLSIFLQGESKKIDFEINSHHFTDEFNIKILASRGALIFGIPSVLSKSITLFNGLTFNYLVDELENFNETQQIYISTLIREKSEPSNFKIGVRPYGIKTAITLADGEKNKKGHEVTHLKLDDLIRTKSTQYEKFAVDLIIHRLANEKFISSDQLEKINYSDSEKRAYLNSIFESPKFDLTSALDEYSKYISDIGKIISTELSSKKINDVDVENFTETIKSNLSYPGNALVERTGVSIFSSLWAKKEASYDEIIHFSEMVKDEYKKYSNGNGSKKIEIKFGHNHNDFLAAHLRLMSQNNLEQYTGIDNILVITLANPRALLSLLQFSYKYEVFSGNLPFVSGQKISIESQKVAIRESFNDFYNDAETEGELGSEVMSSISRIAEFMRKDRYSHKPVESSVSSFSVDATLINSNARDVLKWAQLIGVIFELEHRQEKNSQSVIRKFYINPILCPKWGISITRRGSLDFKPEEFDILFDKDKVNEFSQSIKEFSRRRNLPFKISRSEQVGDSKQIDMGI